MHEVHPYKECQNHNQMPVARCESGSCRLFFFLPPPRSDESDKSSDESKKTLDVDLNGCVRVLVDVWVKMAGYDDVYDALMTILHQVRWRQHEMTYVRMTCFTLWGQQSRLQRVHIGARARAHTHKEWKKKVKQKDRCWQHNRLLLKLLHMAMTTKRKTLMLMTDALAAQWRLKYTLMITVFPGTRVVNAVFECSSSFC